jgi:anti-sigma-K factor RskA
MARQELSQDDIALAAELVLGLLDPAEHAMAQARIATDPLWAKEVAAWEARLHPMLGTTDVVPPDAIWEKVKAEIAPATGQDNKPSGLRLWQGISAVSTAAAVLLGLMVLQQPSVVPPQQTPPPLIAALGSETGNAAMTASYDSQSGTLTLTPVAMDTGRLYPELWLIPADGKARSLGIVTADKPTRMPVTPAFKALMDQGVTLAITPEPAGGAPGGKATGPVIASGKLVLI